MLKTDDDTLVGTADRVSLQRALASLPERERKIVYLASARGRSLTGRRAGRHLRSSARLLRASR
jgi:hypothetical protein